MSKVDDCPCSGGTLDKLIQPAILAALSHGPLHGYKLAEHISEMAGCSTGKPDLSGIYRFLKAMEARGLVVSSWDTPEKGHARRCFQITTRRHGLSRQMDHHAGSLPSDDQRFAEGSSGSGFQQAAMRVFRNGKASPKKAVCFPE